MEMIKIGAIDSLTKDRIIKLESCERARAFLARPEVAVRLEKNDKTILTESEYHEFSAIAAENVVEEHIGGSAFNTCTTIAAALETAVVSFITPPSANKTALPRIANFKFIPADPADAHMVTPRVSFICLDQNGSKQVLKYLGNIYNYLKTHPAYLVKLKISLAEVITSADLFFLPGGITKKFPLEIFTHALSESAKHKTKLVFALPTHSDFSRDEIELYNRALAQATIILGNADELKNTINASGNNIPAALDELKKLSATSFITDGAADTYIIANGEIARIAPLSLTPKTVSFTGAGDSAFAGFLIGLLREQTPADAGKIAMIFANEVLKISAARLPNPRSILSLLGEER